MISVDDELIDRVLEGEATEAESAAFQAWLNVPENLERFALRAELQSDLRRSLRRRDIQRTALEASPEAVATETVSRPDKLTVSALRTRKARVLTQAGLLTAACVLIFVVWLQTGRNANSSSSHAASIVSNVDGQLTKDGSVWDNAQIPVGDYELQQGLLSLRFGGGVMVYVEAPARFDATSDKRVILHSGRLSARVPPEGIGFTVETPEAEVVDFGTEFSVDVEGGASEVHVFDGLVRVNPAASDQRDALRSVDLKAAQAVRITDGATELEDISIATDRFIRDFDEPRLNYARTVKRLSPICYYRMSIRDLGLTSEPPEYSGVVLKGEGRRPPHACGVFAGGSLRVGADSTGRGGLVETPPTLSEGAFSIAVFVYLETPSKRGEIVTNLSDLGGTFGLSVTRDGTLRAVVRAADGTQSIVSSESVLPPRVWRHVVVTVDGQHVRYYEDGRLAALTPSAPIAASDSAAIWFGTDAGAKHVLDGRVDEVAFFDRALSDEDVASLYHTAQQQIQRTR